MPSAGSHDMTATQAHDTNGRDQSGWLRAQPIRLDPVVVLLVDEMRLLRECLATLLEDSAPDLRVDSIGRCAEAAALSRKPDVVLLNLRSTSVGDPRFRTLSGEVAEVGLDAPILGLSDLCEPALAALEAIACGLRGWFPASLDPKLLVAAVRLVAAGGIFVPPAVLERCAAQAPGANAGREDVVFLGMSRREARIRAKLDAAEKDHTVAYDVDPTVTRIGRKRLGAGSGRG